MLLGVDVGGTFTDAVLFDEGSLTTAKVPTTPGDQSESVLAAVARVLAERSALPSSVRSFAHGMTVATNALLEERGARTALLATEGFTDLLDVGRQNRPELYRLCAPKPAPLVDRELRFEVPERVGAGGVIAPLEVAALDDLVRRVSESGAEAVAICLLFAHVEPAHEAEIAGRLRESLPGVHVSASHEVLPRFREYERTSTTVIDAYLSPLLGRYLERLVERARTSGLPEPTVMQSSGGAVPASEAAATGARCVLSGPAGGAVGAAVIANLSAGGNALGLDMGGTSCDVCVVEDGRVRRTEAREIDGRPLQLPMVDVHTVGAGGGSIGWRDPGGALRVGPRSAGADPGPACYGRGGREPTVTDANLVLGYLPSESELATDVKLDVQAAGAALEELGDSLELDPIGVAEGIVRVANQEMVRALRVVTVERGVDPRDFALLPFGGAGPMHAAGIAAELGVDRIVCPRAGGVLSALGLVASERRRDTTRTVMLRGVELTTARIAAAVDALTAEIGEGLEAAQREVVYEIRYRGQGFELDVPGDPSPDLGELRERFEATHEQRYGYRDPDAEIELVSVRVALIEPGPNVHPTAALTSGTEETAREARFDGQWVEAVVLRGEPAAEQSAMGPYIYELPEATLVVPPGWVSRVDAFGAIHLEQMTARP